MQIKQADVHCTKNQSVKVSTSKGAGLRAWLVWAVSACFVLFQFFVQLSSGEIVDGVIRDFNVSAFTAGIVISSYYYIYVLLQTPAGLLIDRYGPRLLLTLGAFIIGLGCYGFAIAHSVWLAVVARVLMGAGASFAFVGCLNLIARWFPAHRFAYMTALAEVFGMLGSIVGGLMLASMLSHFSWRQCTLFAAVVAAVLSVLLFVIVRDRSPQLAAVQSVASTPVSTSMWPKVKQLLSRPVTWFNALYSGLVFGTVSVFIAMWAVPFLQAAYRLPLLTVTGVTDFAFIGIAVACPVIGYLDGVIACRRWVMSLFPLFGALCLWLLFYCSLPVWLLCVLMLVLGVCLSSYFITFVIGNEIASPQTQATSVGFVNTLSVGTAPLLQPLVGAMLDRAHPSAVAASYSVSAFQSALWVVPVCLLLAAMIGFFLPKRS